MPQVEYKGLSAIQEAIAGAIGRTMSPIAGVTIVCAGLAMVSPVEMVKRTAPGMILATLFLALFML